MLRYGPLVALLGLTLVGCGSPNHIPTPDEAADATLTQVGEMYRTYQILNNRPPGKLADLNVAAAVSANALEAIRKGDVVVLFGTPMVDLKEDPGPPSSDVVLVYEKAVPESGGKVLLLDRHVKAMTADEFKAAPKSSASASK